MQWVSVTPALAYGLLILKPLENSTTEGGIEWSLGNLTPLYDMVRRSRWARLAQVMYFLVGKANCGVAFKIDVEHIVVIVGQEGVTVKLLSG